MVLEFTKFRCQFYGNDVVAWMKGDYAIITCNAKLAKQIFAKFNLKNFITHMGKIYSLKEVGIYQKGIIRNKDISKLSLLKRESQFDIVIIFEITQIINDVDYFKSQEFFILKLCKSWQLLRYRKSFLKPEENLGINTNSNSQISSSFLHHLHNYTNEKAHLASIFYIKDINLDNQLMNLISSSSESLLNDVLRGSMQLMRFKMASDRKSLSDCDILGIHIQASINPFIKLISTNRRFKFVKLDETSKIINTKTKWEITQQPIIEKFINILPKKNIFIVGAHSVGKTTIAKIIKIHNNNAILVDEIARTIIENFKIDVNALLEVPENYFKFETSIIKIQCAVEEQFEHKFAIFDRCILEAIVYTKIFCKELWKKLLTMKEVIKCLERYRQHNEYIFFLIEPHKECMENDGVRKLTTDLDELVTFSNILKNLMDEFNIKYHLITDLDINQRYSKIMNTVLANN
ncbi:hypothetical protein F8M41_008106 [Gigaspora margarita]|uniref:NadR/Ttd14 AAA domain-containing protein n=1 Tax=Gigaspora margarita TaxID=4874 RepID=A0A8H3X5T9_GIGMA|nr:hypothetical protein F8M41_008106 [Gigaspora margarita]